MPFENLPYQNSTVSRTFWLLNIRHETYFPSLNFWKANPGHSVARTQFSSKPLALWEQHIAVEWPTIYELPRCSLMMFQNAKWFFHLGNCSQLMFSGNERFGMLFLRRGEPQAGPMPWTWSLIQRVIAFPGALLVYTWDPRGEAASCCMCSAGRWH